MTSAGITRRASLSLAALFTGTLLTGTAQADSFTLVTNGNDAGQGSLRHALQQGKTSEIFILPTVSSIRISTPLEYNKRNALTILGSGQTILTDRNITLLAINEGADVRLSDLSFKGPRGFSINNRGDVDGEAGKGIFVNVRDDQTGVVTIDLENVSVSGVANHGVHISDCSLADNCGAGAGGAGTGSDASIFVSVDGVTVEDVGNGTFDADGLRVDDRSAGDIFFTASNSTFSRVGADGVELDEGGQGQVYVDIRNSGFTDNGGYCDPELLRPYLPVAAEGEFDESEQVTQADIPAAVDGSPDDGCFERSVELYDSGFVKEYEIALDPDDGIDLDEAGEGDLIATLKRTTISGNRDEGMDFDESGDGSVLVRLHDTRAFDNTDDGFKTSEADAGSVVGHLRRVVSTDNGGKGAAFEEAGSGDLDVTVIRSHTANNDDSDDTGLDIAQDDAGDGILRVRASTITDGIDTDGVEQR
ncbi:hypothetical protein [Marinobacter subterrani]|uniref:hypothetical protein n=1 Tax=Marinobacter subterrani TaxID=1658765 RepID=UPI002352C7B0|nr:hypothetical protein [Marinobacter subterrani]